MVFFLSRGLRAGFLRLARGSIAGVACRCLFKKIKIISPQTGDDAGGRDNNNVSLTTAIGCFFARWGGRYVADTLFGIAGIAEIIDSLEAEPDVVVQTVKLRTGTVVIVEVRRLKGLLVALVAVGLVLALEIRPTKIFSFGTGLQGFFAIDFQLDLDGQDVGFQNDKIGRIRLVDAADAEEMLVIIRIQLYSLIVGEVNRFFEISLAAAFDSSVGPDVVPDLDCLVTLGNNCQAVLAELDFRCQEVNAGDPVFDETVIAASVAGSEAVVIIDPVGCQRDLLGSDCRAVVQECVGIAVDI